MTTTFGNSLRRLARGLTEEQALEVLKNTDHAVLSTTDVEGYPYGVPISPVWSDGALYFHATAEPGGRKEENMRMNPKVSVCFIGKAVTLPHWYSVDYASVIVRGTVSKVEDEAEKKRAIGALLKRHAPSNSGERNVAQMRERYPHVAVWKITVDGICGKARAAQDWHGAQSLNEVQELAPSPWLVGVPF